VGYASYTYFPDLDERKVDGAKKVRLLPEGGTQKWAGAFLDKLDVAKASDPRAHYCSSCSFPFPTTPSCFYSHSTFC
jgi:hypothetical protein